MDTSTILTSKPRLQCDNMLGMIVACDRNGAIGKDGDLPGRQSTDLQHFKRITMGSNLIMGRKTWESLPGILPGREHFVLSRGEVEGVEVISFEQGLEILTLEKRIYVGILIPSSGPGSTACASPSSRTSSARSAWTRR